MNCGRGERRKQSIRNSHREIASSAPNWVGGFHPHRGELTQTIDSYVINFEQRFWQFLLNTHGFFSLRALGPFLHQNFHEAT